MSNADTSCRVLSIQSHVVSGYVGNKAAVFPLQLLGFDVDFINSVQFSNHTGYPNKWKGTVLSGTELSALCEGLRGNELLDYNYLLTGYIGSETFLASVLETLNAVQEVNPSARYVCDPVLGDHNQYYVPAALVDIFRSKLIPRAYMITPNQFEAELLSGIKIRNEGDAVKALIHLHKLGPEVVVLTSAEFPSYDTNGAEQPGGLHCYVLYPAGSQDAEHAEVTCIEIAKMEGHYTGTGDATAALMLAWVHLLRQAQSGEGKAEEPHSGALLRALATVKAMISRSQARASRGLDPAAEPGSSSRDSCLATRRRELQVVQSKADIEVPPVDRLAPRSVRSWTVSLSDSSSGSTSNC